MESIVGKILYDRYRIIQELSQDDFGTVYVAEDLERHNNKSQCHIEQIQPQYDNEVLGAKSWRKVFQTFIERGTILKNLSQHPQIPELLDFFECDRYFYLVRECIEGESLAQKLERSPISEAEAVTWLKEILVILEFVHQAEIAHLNIQPSSLLEHQDGRKFLTDFATVKNAVAGNKNWSAIEIDSSSPNDPESPVHLRETKVPAGNRWSEISGYSSDIRALGTTIIYALSNKIPEQTHPKIARESAYNSSSYNSAIDNIRPELASVLNKMIGNRYHSTAEVLAELDFNQNVVTFPPPLLDNLVLANSKSKQTTSSNRRATNSSAMVQKIIWLLLALPFIVASGIIFIGINKNYYRNLENYVNDDYEFTIEYPQDWSYQELNDPITGTIVVFTSPLETDADIFQEKVYFGVEHLTASTTNLTQYTQTVFDRIKQAKGSDLEIQKDFETTIDKSPARVIIYSREESGLKLRQMEAFTIKNNRVYIAIYMAEEKEFAKFFKTARKIIDSWEIQ